MQLRKNKMFSFATIFDQNEDLFARIMKILPKNTQLGRDNAMLINRIVVEVKL